MQHSRKFLLDSYRSMATIRRFEDRVHDEFAGGKIPGFVHLYAGEEASAVGVCSQLGTRDVIASTHRGHGHCIAKGCDVVSMMKEIYGRRDGLCGGKGGSMHIADLAKGMMGANGIVGGGPPLICGAALTAKYLKTGGVAVAFVGDGGSNQGTTLEIVQSGEGLAVAGDLRRRRQWLRRVRLQAHGLSEAVRSAAPPGSACRESKSTDSISSRSTTPRARRSNALGTEAGRR